MLHFALVIAGLMAGMWVCVLMFPCAWTLRTRRLMNKVKRLRTQARNDRRALVNAREELKAASESVLFFKIELAHEQDVSRRLAEEKAAVEEQLFSFKKAVGCWARN